MKVILMLSAIVLAVYFIDNSAASPYPSIGKGKSKRLGKCAFLLMICFALFVELLVYGKLEYCDWCRENAWIANSLRIVERHEYVARLL